MSFKTVTHLKISEAAEHVLQIDNVIIGTECSRSHDKPHRHVYVLQNALFAQGGEHFKGDLIIHTSNGVVVVLKASKLYHLPNGVAFADPATDLEFIGFIQNHV